MRGESGRRLQHQKCNIWHWSRWVSECTLGQKQKRPRIVSKMMMASQCNCISALYSLHKILMLLYFQSVLTYSDAAQMWAKNGNSLRIRRKSGGILVNAQRNSFQQPETCTSFCNKQIKWPSAVQWWWIKYRKVVWTTRGGNCWLHFCRNPRSKCWA